MLIRNQPLENRIALYKKSKMIAVDKTLEK